MDDSGLDWEWTRAEFRKALLACTNAGHVDDVDEGEGLVGELRACALLMLNFRHRLSSKQQKDLSKLAAACEFTYAGELGSRDDPEADAELTRDYFDGALKYVQRSKALFEGI